MTNNETIREVLAAVHGGADLATIEARTRWLDKGSRESALRALIVAGTVYRTGSRFHPRERLERQCLRCGQSVESNRRGAFRGEAVMCGACERSGR